MHTHIYGKSDRHDYDKCVICGTYMSVSLATRDELYKNNYWSHEHGRSTIEEQVYNLESHKIDGVSKVEKIFSYLTVPGSLLEIGCAPGVLLKKAVENGFAVCGVEPDGENIPSIKQVVWHPVQIIEGYFPECLNGEYDPFDYIIALDVLEHIKDYKEFIQSVYSILSPGGLFIFMSPINTEELSVRDIDYCAKEHAWIFSKQYLQEYLGELFWSVTFDIWTQGHNIIICKK